MELTEIKTEQSLEWYQRNLGYETYYRHTPMYHVRVALGYPDEEQRATRNRYYTAAYVLAMAARRGDLVEVWRTVDLAVRLEAEVMGDRCHVCRDIQEDLRVAAALPPPSNQDRFQTEADVMREINRLLPNGLFGGYRGK